MPEKLVLIHGWSDCSYSFKKLKDSLSTLFSANDIYFVDYESREDHMSFNDVVDGLRDSLIAKGLIKKDNSVEKGNELNVIVHSTGGLVIRDFVSRYYSGTNLEKCPIKRIVMLAPANFGSPLAHMGKSTIGSFAAGRKEIGNFLETGRQILTGLELASPYQWALAERDVIHETQFYSPKTIQTTVLVGIGKYDGIKQAVNKPGTDGTVVVSGTNLNSMKFVFNFSKGELDFDRKQTVSNTAFGTFAGINHSTIVDHAADTKSQVHKTICDALKVTSEVEFEKHKLSLTELSNAAYEKSGEPRFQQFVVRVTDDFGNPVNDYRLEFFISSKTKVIGKSKALFGIFNIDSLTDPQVKLSDEISSLICGEFYQHSEDKSYRRFLVDTEKVQRAIKQASHDLKDQMVLSVKLHLPAIDRGIRYDSHQMDNIVIYDPAHQSEEEPDIFYPNTTTLLEFKVNRFNTYVFVDTQPSTQVQREQRYLSALTGK